MAPVVCHGDYRIGNILRDDGGKISGALDWERAWASDPICDSDESANLPHSRGGLGGGVRRASSIEFSQIHHIGIIVSDLDGAMNEFSSRMAVTWAPIRHGERIVRHLGRRVTTDLRLTYSIEGPPHLELIGEAPGTPWEPTGGGIHHAGFWVDDLRAAGLVLTRAGMTLEATYDAEDGGLLGFAYFTDANGFRVELLDDSRRQAFDDWLAGEPG